MASPALFRWHRIHRGLPYFAAVGLDARPTTGTPAVVDAYAGSGFGSQGYVESIPAHGYDTWKAGARAGLTSALSRLPGAWVVTVREVVGLGTDTNPTIVGYTAIRALCEATGTPVPTVDAARWEEFTLASWDHAEEIPDFDTFTWAPAGTPRSAPDARPSGPATSSG